MLTTVAAKPPNFLTFLSSQRKLIGFRLPVVGVTLAIELSGQTKFEARKWRPLCLVKTKIDIYGSMEKGEKLLFCMVASLWRCVDASTPDAAHTQSATWPTTGKYCHELVI